LKIFISLLLLLVLSSCSTNKVSKKERGYSLEEKKSKYIKFWNDKKVWNTKYKNNISDEEKIAGLSRLWMEAKYNFAFFDQVKDLHWDQTYFEYISKVKKTKNTKEYYKILHQFYALLKDGHTDIGYPKELGIEIHARPLIRQSLIEGKVIVTSVDDKGSNISVGDEIIAVNNIEVNKYAEKYVKPYISSSTSKHLDHKSFEIKLLRGKANSFVKVKFKTLKGETYARKLKRYLITNKLIIKLGIRKDTVEHRWIGKYAYFNVRHVSNKGVFEYIKSLVVQYKKAKGVILDFRENGGGNTWVGWNILQLFTNQEIEGISWNTREYRPTLRAWSNDNYILNEVSYIDMWSDLSKMEKNHDGGVVYEMPVRMLIGRQTFSAGEDTAIALKSNNLGLLIGENTAGSTGQPLLQGLPGGGWFRVCTKRDYGVNNLDWVGVGVTPDIKVNQTLDDFYNGKDTVLDKAVQSFKL
jgi:carboxyl-terminal processing protease